MIKSIKSNFLFKVLFFSFLVCFVANAQDKSSYSNVLNDSSNWIIEQQPNGIVTVSEGKMEIIDAKGCTVWFKNKLEGNCKIVYNIVVIDDKGMYDRVSDMNCFWMVKDPNNPNDFFKESKQRAGLFPNYHHLKLYYVGYGGHDNSKTRFRRYDGNLDRPLLPEHDLSDKKFMIVANNKRHIEILVKDKYTCFKRDGEIIFEMNDTVPYTSGYFGFRTAENHMLIENFKVTKLK